MGAAIKIKGLRLPNLVFVLSLKANVRLYGNGEYVVDCHYKPDNSRCQAEFFEEYGHVSIIY